MEHMQELCVDVRNWPSALSPAHTSSTLFSVVVFLEYIVKVAYFFFFSSPGSFSVCFLHPGLPRRCQDAIHPGHSYGTVDPTSIH